MKNITPRQKEILDYICMFRIEHKFSPSFQEISDHFGFTPTSTSCHLERLQKKGYIAMQPKRPRSIKVLKAVSVFHYNIGSLFVQIAPKGTAKMKKKKKKKQRKRDALDAQKIIDLYHDGNTVKEIAIAFGLSDTPIRHVLLDNNVTLRTKRETRQLMHERSIASKKEQYEAIVEHYESGASITECAKKSGVSYPTVRRILDNAGVEIRPPGTYHTGSGMKFPEAELKRLYIDEMLSLKSIADKYGVTAPTIAKALDAIGVKRRKFTERPSKPETDKNPSTSHIQENGQEVTVVQYEKWIDPITVNRSDSLFDMRKAGLKINDIAKIKGITPVEVYNALEAKGIR